MTTAAGDTVLSGSREISRVVHAYDHLAVTSHRQSRNHEIQALIADQHCRRGVIDAPLESLWNRFATLEYDS